jgi:hypothetical protein
MMSPETNAPPLRDAFSHTQRTYVPHAYAVPQRVVNYCHVHIALQSFVSILSILNLCPERCHPALRRGACSS